MLASRDVGTRDSSDRVAAATAAAAVRGWPDGADGGGVAAGDDDDGQRAPRCEGGALSFTAWDSFKKSSRERGEYKLVAKGAGDTNATLARGAFHFRAHWLPTRVSVEVGDLGLGRSSASAATRDRGEAEEGGEGAAASWREVELVVTNARGKAARVALNCTAAAASSSSPRQRR